MGWIQLCALIQMGLNNNVNMVPKVPSLIYLYKYRVHATARYLSR